MSNPILFELAKPADLPKIMPLVTAAIANMQASGIRQWHKGYPAKSHIETDIKRAEGHVLSQAGEILVYGAIIGVGEPAYNKIDGQWLTDGPYLAIHRLLTNPAYTGQNLASQFLARAENMGREQGFLSVRIDTNHDNRPMLNFLKKHNFSFCGEILLQGGARLAFEKILTGKQDPK